MTASRSRTRTDSDSRPAPTARQARLVEARAERRASQRQAARVVQRERAAAAGAAEWVGPRQGRYVPDAALVCPTCRVTSCQHVAAILAARAGAPGQAAVTATPLIRGTAPGVLADDVITVNGSSVRPWLEGQFVGKPVPDPLRPVVVIRGGHASTLIARAGHLLSTSPVGHAIEVGIHSTCGYGCKTYAVKRVSGLSFHIWHSGAYGCPDSRVTNMVTEDILMQPDVRHRFFRHGEVVEA